MLRTAEKFQANPEDTVEDTCILCLAGLLAVVRVLIVS